MSATPYPPPSEILDDFAMHHTSHSVGLSIRMTEEPKLEDTTARQSHFSIAKGDLSHTLSPEEQSSEDVQRGATQTSRDQVDVKPQGAPPASGFEGLLGTPIHASMASSMPEHEGTATPTTHLSSLSGRFELTFAPPQPAVSTPSLTTVMRSNPLDGDSAVAEALATLSRLSHVPEARDAVRILQERLGLFGTR